MIPEVGTLTLLLNKYLEVFQLSRVEIGKASLSLLTITASIELTLLGAFWALTGSDAITGLIRKILAIGFFLFVIDNYDSLLKSVIGGFIYTGQIASRDTGDVFQSFRDPSGIMSLGYKAVFPIMDHIKSATSISFEFVADLFICAFCGAAIYLSYLVIAVQIFITYIEFGLITTLGLIFVPFGVLRHTSFLVEKLFGAIISHGVKLMVLGLLVSISMPLIKDFFLPESPTWTQLLNMTMLSVSLAALSWHAPGLAAGLLAGGPSLTAGNAFSSALTAGAGIALGAGVAAKGVGATARFAGKMSGYNQVSKENSKMANGGESSDGIGSKVMRGAASFGKSAVHTASSPVRNAYQSVKDNFNQGKDAAPGYQAFQAGKTESGGASASNQKKDLKSKVVSAAMMMHGARHAVSDSSGPKNNLSVAVDTKEDK